jgi:hypothetical protein
MSLCGGLYRTTPNLATTGDRLLVFINMKEHVLRGHLAKYMLKMGLAEVMHHGWGNEEPHTYFRGT